MRSRRRSGVSTTLDGTTAFLELHGEVDITSVLEIESAFLDLVERGAERIVVDFTATTFADSKVIEEVMRSGQSAQRAGAEVVAAAARGPVARAIEVCGLEHAMAVCNDREAALAATGARGGGDQ
jgi:anti-anti-sigma factor